MVNGASAYLVLKKRSYFNGRSLTWRKFLCVCFFAFLATQLLILRDQSSDENHKSLLNFWRTGDSSFRGKPGGYGMVGLCP